MLVTLLALLASMGAHASTVSGRLADLDDPVSRLDFAERMAADPDLHEEARDALGALVGDPSVGHEARISLADLCIQADPRPGWIGLYKELASDRRIPADRKRTLELRQAQAQAELDRGSRSTAKGMARMVARYPTRLDYRVDYAKALLNSRQPGAALVQLERAKDMPGAAELRIYAWVATGKLESAKKLWAATPSVQGRAELSKALASGRRVDRVDALWKGGFPSLAEYMMSTEDGTGRYKDGPAWRRIGDLRLTQDRAIPAAWAYRAALLSNASDSQARQGATHAYLVVGALPEARKWAGKDGVALRMVEAYEATKAAEKIEDPTVRRRVLGQAWQQVPDHAPIARAYAAAVLESAERDSDGNLVVEARIYDVLAGILDDDPDDTAALWAYGLLSLEQDRPEGAHDRFQAAAESAATPARRDELRVDLASWYAAYGGWLHQQHRYDEAIESYTISQAMRPNRGDVLNGLGGALWDRGNELAESGRAGEAEATLDQAETAFAMAYLNYPRPVEALVAGVTLMLSRGRLAEAEALLSLRQHWTPETEQLETDLDVARRIELAREYWDNGQLVSAQQELDELVDTWPEEGRAWHALGDFYLARGQAREALTAYETAEVLRPGDPWITLGVARALTAIKPPQLGRAELILDSLADAGTEEPQTIGKAVRRARAGIHLARGNQLRAQGRRAEAFESYAKALSVGTSDPWPSIQLANLYLDNGQPGPALAHYRDALELEPDNLEARKGVFMALGALGRQEEARAALIEMGVPARDSALWTHYQDLEVHARIAAIDRAGLWGRPDAVSDILAMLESEYPGSAEVQAARASLWLEQERYGRALDAAQVALMRDPDNGRATGVVLEAGFRGRQMAHAVQVLESAKELGGGTGTRAALDDARFLLKVETAVDRGRAGRVSYARTRLDELEDQAQGHSDRLAAIGGARLSLNDRAGARVAFQAALDENPDHLQSILGLAGTWESAGDPGRAEEILSEAYNRTTWPELGVALAELQGRRGDWRGALATLDALDERPAGASLTGRRSDPLPVVRTRNGVMPSDPLPASMSSRSTALTVAEREAVEQRVLAHRGPAIDVGAGVLNRTGYRGEGWLLATLGEAQLRQVPMGAMSLHANAVVVQLDDGEDLAQGGAGAVGLSVPIARNLKGRGEIGVSPVGFEADPYLTWLAQLSVKTSDGAWELAADTGRTPQTDSLTSWAGKVDDNGVLFGGVSYLWGGGWVSLRTITDFEAGIRGRYGYLEGYSLDPVLRSEITAWVGQRFGEEDRWSRLGLSYTLIQHSRQADAFVAGEGGGFFSPNRFQELAARFDGGWTPGERRPGFCGGVMAGIQSVEAEQETLIVDPGLHTVVGGHASLSQPLGDELSAALSGRVSVVDTSWSEQSVILQLGYRPALSGLSPIGTVSPIHGSEPSSMTPCVAD